MLSSIYSHCLKIINLVCRSIRSNNGSNPTITAGSYRTTIYIYLYIKVDEKNEQIAHRRIVAEWETKESWTKQQFASHRPAAATLPSGHKVPVLPSSVSAVMSDPNAGQNSVLNLLDRPGFDRMSRCVSRGTHKFLERSSSPNLQQFNFVLLAVKTGDLLRL